MHLKGDISQEKGDLVTYTYVELLSKWLLLSAHPTRLKEYLSGTYSLDDQAGK